jgi:23S rRNA (uracil1939-C5)-methyltransferase
LIRIVEEDLRAAGFDAFDPRTRVGTIRHVFAEASPAGSRVVIALAHPVPDHRFENVLARKERTALAIDVLPKRGAGTFSAPRALRGPLHLTLELGGDRLRATLPAWTPQAPDTIGPLRDTVLAWLAPTRVDRVVEVGCGIGTLSLPIARVTAQFTGIDKSRVAIMDAQTNATLAGVTGCNFWVGDARHGLRRLLAKGEQADLVLLHAMRRPFGPEVMSAIRALRPRRVVYLAPNPMALADDLRALAYGEPPRRAPVSDERKTPTHGEALRPRAGYALMRGGLVDQAPGTMDFLSVVVLDKVSHDPL